ncbi:hypothetical protein D3C87_1600990 [compost metagenome]
MLKFTSLAARPLLKLGVQANKAFPVPSAVVSTPSPPFEAFAVTPFPLPSAMAMTAGPFPAGLEEWNNPAKPPVPDDSPYIPAVPKLENCEFTSPFTAADVPVTRSTLKFPAIPFPTVVTVITSLVFASLKMLKRPALPVANVGTQA